MKNGNKNENKQLDCETRESLLKKQLEVLTENNKTYKYEALDASTLENGKLDFFEKDYLKNRTY
ncbi:MAG: hypothetical protein ACOX3T_00360 [Bdellovibrionota bacterium]